MRREYIYDHRKAPCDRSATRAAQFAALYSEIGRPIGSISRPVAKREKVPGSSGEGVKSSNPVSG
jgi:hypothetical protein